MKYENCGEKQTIEYTHTVVPASMRSPYWKYFGFPSDSSNKILTRQKIICTLCGTAITYNKNTSNLRTHLISRHPERLHEIQQQQRQQCTLSGGGSMDAGDSDGASTDIFNEIEIDEENKAKVQIGKRASATDPNVCSVLKIKRLSAGYRGANKVQIDNEDDGRCQRECEVVTMADKDPLNSKESQNDQQSCSNQTDEHIVVNHGGYEFLNSEAGNVSTITAAEADINCTHDFNVETTIHTDEDEFVESEAVILGSEITQNSMFDYSSNSSQCSAGQAKKSIGLQRNASPNEMLADMLVMDLLPVNVLQGLGFRKLLSSVGITNVDKCEIERKILGDWCQMQRNLKKYISTKLLQQDKPYSLSIENYVNNDQNVFSIYVNFLDFHFENKLESILYADIVCSKETDLLNALQDFDLSRCAAIVTTAGHNAIINDFATAHGIEVIPCLDALLTRCVSLIFEQDVVSEMFHRIRQNQNLTELRLHCPWSKLKHIQDFLDNPRSNDMQSGEISSELEPFMAYINPLKITFDTINSEPLPLCTLVRPLITKLFEEHFLVFNTDGNVYLQSAQNIINAELRMCITKCSFFSEAVLFDARFQHDFIQPKRHPMQQKQQNGTFDSIQREELVAAVRQRFQRLMTSELNIKREQKQQSAMPQAVLKSSLRSFFHRISDVAGAANRKNNNNLPPKLSEPEDATDLEFNRYKCEPTLDLDQCPISWWQLQAQHYKQLYKIANYYLSVPCCALRWPMSVNDEAEWNDRGVWWQKRRSLPLQHPVEKCLWYLHYNRGLFDKIKLRPQSTAAKKGDV